MEANALTPRQLFDGNTHFEIPPFQRPYVWTENDQWAPLWGDIERVATECTLVDLGERPGAGRHFMGAVVYETKGASAGDVAKHEVIDGQQRITTIQVILRAAQSAMEVCGDEESAEAVGELVLNKSSRFRGKPAQFKVWPSQSDRAAFERVMLQRTSRDADAGHGLDKAYSFFHTEISNWLVGEPDLDGVRPPGDIRDRIRGLASALEDHLTVVAIDLTGEDDSQLIFETLNDRGTPLLKADLIKNWVFRWGERNGADVTNWAAEIWSDFDDPWWREEATRGRLTRARIDIFLQYWLSMKTCEEVRTEETFRVFTRFAEPRMSSAAQGEEFLWNLRDDADQFRKFADLDENTVEGRFYHRVIERLELAVTTPLLLWFLSKSHDVPQEQRAIGLQSLGSWAVRRTLLRMTTKDLNKFSILALRVVTEAGPSRAGRALQRLLSEQVAPSRLWPTDQDLLADLPPSRVYGHIRQDRLGMIFAEIETHMRRRSSKYESVSLPPRLQIEHIMPRGWRSHWDEGLDEVRAGERDRLVDTLGNLTVVTGNLNGALSNRPWRDADSEGLRAGGAAGRGKWSLLNDYSLLVLNKDLIDRNRDEWTESAIRDRGVELTRMVCEIWAGPDMGVRSSQAGSIAHVRENRRGAEWSRADIAELARDSNGAIGKILDALAEISPDAWSNREFQEHDDNPRANSAIGGLTSKLKASFPGLEHPVLFTDRGGIWYWSLSPQFAAIWLDEREKARRYRS
ncbi:DUF262 domain-containing protein [Kocuria marina]|uniref:DUF262 domain-containing protein n=1 Tax=Kocuria marina TaxID=223184 RepID=UPI0022E566A7|nr:DUF262 domain-containing HNH endonuclease family protein [Kocuria marina]